MRTLLAILPLAGAAVLQAASPSLPAFPVRTWTSSDGRSIRAALLEFSEQSVKVRRENDRRVVDIPLDRLSEDDQKAVQDLVRERKRNNGLKQGPYAAQIKGEFAPGQSKEGLNFQLFGSPEWDGTKRYPLVVWLHGAGQSGTDNFSQLAGHPKQWFTPEAQAAKPCFGLAPQCPSREVGWKSSPAEFLIMLIRNLIDELPVDPDRVYLTGSSMGGSGTWYMLAHWPDVFACGVPLCGTGDVKTAETLKNIPVWVFHGDKDESVPVENARKMTEALQEMKGKVMYTELAGEGHLITTVVYSKPTLHDWVFMQRRGGPKPLP